MREEVLMKKRAALLIAAWILLTLLTGCAQQTNSLPAKGEAFTEPVYDWNKSSGDKLIIWGVYPDLERSYIKKALDRYEDLTENDLEVVQIPKEEFEKRMQASVKGEIEKPDILLSYGGTNIETYYPDENFYDFTEEPWVDDLTDTSINQTIYNGKVIGLPHWEASISGTLYNKEIFEKYGLEIPENQEEFMKVCRVLKKKGITPLYLPAKEISMLLYQFPLDSIVMNSETLEKLNEGKIGYADIPEMKKVVKWYKEMAEKGYLGQDYEKNDWDGMNEAMDSGRYAMMLCWDTWLYTDFQGDAAKFGLMPAFVGTPEEGTFEGPNLGLFIVNKNSARLDAALNFITFLADPYNYNAVFENIYTAPVFKNQVASISTPQYLEAEQLIEQKFRDSIAWLRIRGFSQMDASCILEYMKKDSGLSPEDCLKKMDHLRTVRIAGGVETH